MADAGGPRVRRHQEVRFPGIHCFLSNTCTMVATALSRYPFGPPRGRPGAASSATRREHAAFPSTHPFIPTSVDDPKCESAVRRGSDRRRDGKPCSGAQVFLALSLSGECWRTFTNSTRGSEEEDDELRMTGARTA